MRRRRWIWRASVGALAVLAVVGAALRVIPGLPVWLPAVVAGVAALGPNAKDLLDRARLHDAELHALLTQRFLVDERGDPYRVCDLADPLGLGVHRAADVADPRAASRLRLLGLPDGVPLYVPRDCDAALDRALPVGGLVLLEGPSASGKSRTAYEAMRRCLPERRLLVPRDADALRQLVDSGYDLRGSVVWLNDLERFLGPSGLDIQLLHRICPPIGDQRDVVVLATMRPEERRNFELTSGTAQPTERQMARVTSAVLESATSVRVQRRLSERERTRAQEYARDPRITEALQHGGVGFAEYLAAGPATLQRWHRGRDGEQVVGAALVSVAVDFRRAGYLRPLSRAALADLHVHYLDPQDAHRPDLPTVDEGLAWAIQPVRGASACLTCAPDDTYLAFDYLVDHTQDDPASPSVREETWAAVLHKAAPEDALYVGHAAYDAGLTEVAERAFRLAVTSGQRRVRIDAAFNLGVVLHDRGADAEAEQWCRVAAYAEHPVGMNNLGYLLDRRGEQDAALRWYRRAAEAGYVDAMFNLGLLLESRGDDAAAGWYRRAAGRGLAEAAHAMGMLAERRGDDVTAEHWYRRATATLPDAMCALGALLERRGSALEAEYWQTVAAPADARPAGVGAGGADGTQGASGAAAAVGAGGAGSGGSGSSAGSGGSGAGGEATAAFRLGRLLEQLGRGREARRWYDRAARQGCAEAMHLIGYRALVRGDERAAADWYARAAAAGSTQAMNDLGFVHRHRGRDDEAEAWWRRCGQAGSTLAMYDLGFLLERRGRLAEAEQCFRRGDTGPTRASLPRLPVPPVRLGADADAESWYLRAAEAGSAAAMNHLGYLYRRHGDEARAEQWWRRAGEAGDADAAANVGHLLREQGRPGEAEAWWRRAADAGYAPAMTELGLLLRRHGDTRAAEALWQRAADRGDAGAMFNLSVLTADRGEHAAAEAWWRRALAASGEADGPDGPDDEGGDGAEPDPAGPEGPDGPDGPDAP